MKKIAIFTEGQGESIFVRYLLPLVIGYERLSFECLALRANRMFPVPHAYSSPNAPVHFLIVNVGNDEKVASAISERQGNLISKGYDKIIGLRDMFSEAYRKRSNHIDDTVTESFIQAHQRTIQQMSNSDKIHINFAIMELESWFLSMYNLFERIHPNLLCSYIESELGFDLETINPETEFFHPAKKLGEILGLVGKKYGKSADQMESISSQITATDINDAFENGRSMSFATFISQITTCGSDNDVALFQE